ncbi:MAG: hypothetical protein QX199_13990 [Methylococcaceae bacterium]
MSALEIVAVLIILLITIPIVLKIRKKNSSCSHCPPKDTPTSEPTAPEPVKQQTELKPADQPISDIELSTEPQTNETAAVSPSELEPAEQTVSDIEPSVKPQINETAISSPENNSSLPEDSVLKRHYLTHVCTMIAALVPPRPTDAVLGRHYDAMIAAKIDQCLDDKQAMEQLIDDYQNNKPIGTIEIPATNENEAAALCSQASEAVVYPENNSLPQDSILKRHYFTHLCTMLEALVPPRPTDAVLCRHYDAMMVIKIAQCLNDKKAMEQVVYDYENLSA